MCLFLLETCFGSRKKYNWDSVTTRFSWKLDHRDEREFKEALNVTELENLDTINKPEFFTSKIRDMTISLSRAPSRDSRIRLDDD